MTTCAEYDTLALIWPVAEGETLNWITPPCVERFFNRVPDEDTATEGVPLNQYDEVTGLPPIPLSAVGVSPAPIVEPTAEQRSSTYTSDGGDRRVAWIVLDPGQCHIDRSRGTVEAHSTR